MTPLLRPFSLVHHVLSLLLLASAGLVAADSSDPDAPAGASSGADDRAYSVQVLTRIAEPVLEAASKNQLMASLPPSKGRAPIMALEAMGRTLAGIAPWLELGPDATPEGQKRARDIQLALAALHNGLDPQSPDHFNFGTGCGGQALVDSAFLASAFLRAPTQLWAKLSPEDQAQVVAGLQEVTKANHPRESNWLLFPALDEVMLWHFTGSCDRAPIERAVERHLEWYKGDGTYGDGPAFHWDYYNSYVIQPMLLEVLKVCQEKGDPLAQNEPLILKRAQRYAVIQERMISPEGTYPVMGRSSCYRFGAFQTLALLALDHDLPKQLQPAAVRCGLTAVIRRVIETPGTFDDHGFLQPGAVGHQPSMKDSYIASSSLYLCTVGLLQLGLPPDDPFWTDPPTDWTQKRIWSGQNVPGDHALGD